MYNLVLEGACVEAALPKYRFVLAVENSVCQDYVTEKFFNALIRRQIPGERLFMVGSLTSYFGL